MTTPIQTNPIRLRRQLTAWTYRQQGLERSAPDILAALRRVIAVYSAHPAGPLSLAARLPAFEIADFTSLEAGRQIVRIPAMRKSIHIAPRETAGRIFAAAGGTAQSVRYLKNRREALGPQYERWSAAVQAAANHPMRLDELRRTLAGEIPPEAEMDLLVKTLCREGRLLRVGEPGLRASGLRYVTTAAWLGEPLPDLDPDDALAWLGGEYLRAFGPARVSDFAWWVGVSLTRAQAALQTLRPVEVGAGLLLPQSLLEAFQSTEPLPPDGQVALLPKWDAYTMGYPADGRGRFIDPDLQQFAYSQAGDGLPLALVDGRAAAIWEGRFSGDRWVVLVRAPDFLPGPVQARIEAGLHAIGAQLGASAVQVTFDLV